MKGFFFYFFVEFEVEFVFVGDVGFYNVFFLGFEYLFGYRYVIVFGVGNCFYGIWIDCFEVDCFFVLFGQLVGVFFFDEFFFDKFFVFKEVQDCIKVFDINVFFYFFFGWEYIWVGFVFFFDFLNGFED